MAATATTTREALVTAAADLLDEGGLPAVTLREVGRRAGVSHNAPYKHFADKEELLAAVAARELNRQRAAMDALTRSAAAGAGDPGATVQRMIHEYARWALQHPVRFKLTFGRWTTGSPELATAAEATRGALIAAVNAAQDGGSLPAGDPDRIAALLLATAHGAADLALAGHLSPTGKGHAGPDDLIDDLFAHLRRA
jgi:AcrR family transcriptional regulator